MQQPTIIISYADMAKLYKNNYKAFLKYTAAEPPAKEEVNGQLRKTTKGYEFDAVADLCEAFTDIEEPKRIKKTPLIVITPYELSVETKAALKFLDKHNIDYQLFY